MASETATARRARFLLMIEMELQRLQKIAECECGMLISDAIGVCRADINIIETNKKYPTFYNLKDLEDGERIKLTSLSRPPRKRKRRRTKLNNEPNVISIESGRDENGVSGSNDGAKNVSRDS